MVEASDDDTNWGRREESFSDDARQIMLGSLVLLSAFLMIRTIAYTATYRRLPTTVRHLGITLTQFVFIGAVGGALYQSVKTWFPMDSFSLRSLAILTTTIVTYFGFGLNTFDCHCICRLLSS
ncbi:hypothetical protein K458DRAFT_393923 [Lentithecium fluviatile CBS 122367]|uniref:Uncharacterized protein n=1 Tax=Lentithecium fluviatile CBS 122367 TaxID=1168545 RepID=A0A6G1IMY2_9PLEO|nr:hypothetical protein K458DRAFT_393923 [Lentithecium fluviatile CBS 122367]